MFPTHVAGSLCAGSIGSRLSTTVGYERTTNPILAQAASSRDKDEIVQECLRLDNLPAIPPYWRRMRAQNMSGVAALGQPAEPPALTVDECTEQQHAGVLVLDTWPRRHSAVPTCRALNVGLGPAFATWAGTVLPDQAGVVLVLDRHDDLWQASWQLLRIGPPPLGWLGTGMSGWRTSGRPVHSIPQITVHELKRHLDRGDHPAGRSTAQRVACRARRRCPLPHGCPNWPSGSASCATSHHWR